MNGAIIWQGPSLIDGSPIVVIVTGLADATANTKTGDMLQTWILRADVSPVAAASTGEDASICGACPHRPTLYRDAGVAPCYVKVWQAPRSVFEAFQRGQYGYLSPMVAGAGRVVRLGSYGDPAAVPARVWRELLTLSTGRTGYTHQWRERGALGRNARALRPYVMASADTARDHAAATARGWRTFRIRHSAADGVLSGERVCPASKEAGARTTCAACRACSGTAGRGHSSIAIIQH